MNGTRNFQDLDDRDLARLHTHFSLPLVVSDVLRRIGPLSDDEEYAVHLALSEMQPDSALLCIALCCQHIAARHSLDDPDAFTLAAESARVVDAYGPLWLHHAEGGAAASESLIVARLGQVPLDLEALTEAMESVGEGLPASDLCAAQLLQAFRIQAESHALIAESYIETLGMAASLSGKAPVRFSSGEPPANDNPDLIP